MVRLVEGTKGLAHSKTLRAFRAGSRWRQLLECGNGACGVAAFWWDRKLGLGGRDLPPHATQSGDFADFVTAVQNLPAHPMAHTRFMGGAVGARTARPRVPWHYFRRADEPSALRLPRLLDRRDSSHFERSL